MVDENQEQIIDEIIDRIERNEAQIDKCLSHGNIILAAEYAAILCRANAKHWDRIANMGVNPNPFGMVK